MPTTSSSEVQHARPRKPRLAVAPADAHHLLAVTDLVATLDVPAAFDTGPGLGGRIRGALGNAMLAAARNGDGASTRREVLFPSLPAYMVLFGEEPIAPDRAGPADAAPARPFVLFTEAQGLRLTITLRLFGYARRWVPDLRAALRAALRDHGVSVQPLARSWARFPEARVDWADVIVPLALPDSAALRLVTRTPMRLARDGHLAVDAAMLAGSVFSRAAGILAWCGCYLDIDPDVLAAEQRALDLMDNNLTLASVRRRSRRQDRTLDLDGFAGSVSLHHVGPTLRALLPLIEVIGIGASTTAGFGRIVFLPEPSLGRHRSP